MPAATVGRRGGGPGNFGDGLGGSVGEGGAGLGVLEKGRPIQDSRGVEGRGGVAGPGASLPPGKGVLNVYIYIYASKCSTSTCVNQCRQDIQMLRVQQY